MIIEIEDRFGKVAKVFLRMLEKVQRAAERGDAIDAVEELIWRDPIETGHETVVAHVQQQKEKLPRPNSIEYDGKTLQRLPEPRTRMYVSAFGLAPFSRDVYATRETQRQEVVPLDAKLGMPESDTSYLLQKWSATRFVKESHRKSRCTLREIFGFAPSVNCLEDIAARAAEHAEVYVEQRPSIDPTPAGEILVATSDCKGVPMRKIDAPGKQQDDDEAPRGNRLKKGEKNGQKRMACVGGVYSVAPFPRTVDEVLDEILRKEKQPQRPEPKDKQLRAVLTREVDGSGVVEGACRHLVKDRMEQTGMRWRIAGAQAILSLRALYYLNDDWDDFHTSRIQTEQRKLHPYKTQLDTILNCAT